MKQKQRKQIKEISWTFVLACIGWFLFKFIPVQIYGKDILFDASAHIIWVGFVLYLLWFFINGNKNWRIPYYLFSASILVFTSIERIIANKHNFNGIILGLIVIGLAISIPRFREFKKKVKF